MRDNYINGYIVCPCGAKSPTNADPMEPFRWQAKHVCKEKQK